MAKYTVAQLKQAAFNAGWRGSALTIAVAVSLAENGGTMEETATHKNSNGSTDYGAWQINSVHADLMKAHNVKTLQGNADAAYALYKDQGWKPWAATYGSGAYKQHLVAAQKAPTPTTKHNTLLDDVLNPVLQLGGLVTGTDVPNINPNPVAQIAGGVVDFLGHLSDPALWKRVGLGALGVLLLVLGLFVMVESNSSVRSATESAVKVAAVA